MTNKKYECKPLCTKVWLFLWVKEMQDLVLIDSNKESVYTTSEIISENTNLRGIDYENHLKTS